MTRHQFDNFDYFEAGRMWNAGRDTLQIAKSYCLQESAIYRQIETIKKYAIVQRHDGSRAPSLPKREIPQLPEASNPLAFLGR